MEEINFPNCEVIAHGSEIEHHSMKYISTIFIKTEDAYFYLQDETDKIYDVSKMPKYISEDWVNYNKKEVTNFILEKWIATFENMHKWKFALGGLVETDFYASELKSIKRDLTLKKIL